MCIKITSEMQLEDGSFKDVLSIKLDGDIGCWTHTSLVASAIVRDIAQLCSGDYHRLTVNINEDDVVYSWEGAMREGDRELTKIIHALAQGA